MGCGPVEYYKDQWKLQFTCPSDSELQVFIMTVVVSKVSTLHVNMLNVFKIIKDVFIIHILYHILDFVQQKKTRFIKEQAYMLPILYYQYHACWCPGDLSRQGINRHGIDHQTGPKLEYSISSIRKVNYYKQKHA